MELCYLGQSFFLHDSSSFSLCLLLFSCSVVSNSFPPHGPLHARPLCPSPTPGACSNSGSLSQWCHPTMSSSVALLAFCPQSFPASGSSLMTQFFASGRQSTGALASVSVLPMNIWRTDAKAEAPVLYYSSLQQKRVLTSSVYYSSLARRPCPGSQPGEEAVLVGAEEVGGEQWESAWEVEPWWLSLAAWLFSQKRGEACLCPFTCLKSSSFACPPAKLFVSLPPSPTTAVRWEWHCRHF